MNEHNNNICPCCSKGCDLSAPRCSRGEEYLKTGIIPEKERRNHSHEKHRHADYEEMGIDEKILVLLSKLGRMGHGASDGKSSQNRILHILSKTKAMTQRELTEQLEIRPGSASEIIKKLESAGLITRQSNSEDRRTVDIALTDAGKVRVEENDAQLGHANPVLFEVLSEEEKQQLLLLLEKLGQDWSSRFRGDGHGDHKHHRADDHKKRPGQEQEHHHGDKRRHSSDHEHGEKQHRGHRHNS